MNKLYKVLLWTVACLMLVMTLWGLWINFEKTKLNQRYKALIELQEKNAEKSIKLNQELDQIQVRFLDYLDQMKDDVQSDS